MFVKVKPISHVLNRSQNDRPYRITFTIGPIFIILPQNSRGPLSCQDFKIVGDTIGNGREKLIAANMHGLIAILALFTHVSTSAFCQNAFLSQ